ncbi:Reprolysin family propeptide-domain-containing protein, partial [Blastocladiella britannica]
MMLGRRQPLLLLLGLFLLAVPAVQVAAEPAPTPFSPSETAPMLTRRGVEVDRSSEHYFVDISTPQASVDLFHFQKRGAEHPHHAETLSLSIKGPGKKPLHLDLRRSDDLLSPGYQRLAVKGEGLVIQKKPRQRCWYRGSVAGHSGSLVALSTCDGVNGVIHLSAAERYTIHSMPDKKAVGQPQGGKQLRRRQALDQESRTHLLVRDTGLSTSDEAASEESMDGQRMCAVDARVEEVPLGDEPTKLAKRQVMYSVTGNKTVHLLLASDAARTADWSGDFAEQSLIDMANYAAALYAQPDSGLLPSPYVIKLVLVGTIVSDDPTVWAAGGDGKGPVDADIMLRSWCKWRADAKRAAIASGDTASAIAVHDIAHLATGRTMTSGHEAVKLAASIEGYANMGSACEEDRSCGVVRGVRVVNLGTL